MAPQFADAGVDSGGRARTPSQVRWSREASIVHINKAIHLVSWRYGLHGNLVASSLHGLREDIPTLTRNSHTPARLCCSWITGWRTFRNPPAQSHHLGTRGALVFLWYSPSLPRCRPDPIRPTQHVYRDVRQGSYLILIRQTPQELSHPIVRSHRGRDLAPVHQHIPCLARRSTVYQPVHRRVEGMMTDLQRHVRFQKRTRHTSLKPVYLRLSTFYSLRSLDAGYADCTLGLDKRDNHRRAPRLGWYTNPEEGEGDEEDQVMTTCMSRGLWHSLSIINGSGPYMQHRNSHHRRGSVAVA
jgi:hypothetical protein